MAKPPQVVEQVDTTGSQVSKAPLERGGGMTQCGAYMTAPKELTKRTTANKKSGENSPVTVDSHQDGCAARPEELAEAKVSVPGEAVTLTVCAIGQLGDPEDCGPGCSRDRPGLSERKFQCVVWDVSR